MPTILEPERVFPVTPARSATPLAPLNQCAQQWRQSVAEKEEVSNRLVALTTTASMAGIRRIMPSTAAPSIGSADRAVHLLAGVIAVAKIFHKKTSFCVFSLFFPFCRTFGILPYFWSGIPKSTARNPDFGEEGGRRGENDDGPSEGAEKAAATYSGHQPSHPRPYAWLIIVVVVVVVVEPRNRQGLSLSRLLLPWRRSPLPHHRRRPLWGTRRSAAATRTARMLRRMFLWIHHLGHPLRHPRRPYKKTAMIGGGGCQYDQQHPQQAPPEKDDPKGASISSCHTALRIPRVLGAALRDAVCAVGKQCNDASNHLRKRR